MFTMKKKKNVTSILANIKKIYWLIHAVMHKQLTSFLSMCFTLIRSAAFSAITIMAEFGVPEIWVGITEASTTRNLSLPITL